MTRILDYLKRTANFLAPRYGNVAFGSAWSVVPGKRPEDYIAQYGEVGWLFAATSKIADSVASTSWKVVRHDGKRQVELGDDHPAVRLLKLANPFWTSYELFEHTQLYLDLVGEAFWYVVRDKARRPRMLWVLPPHRIKVIPSQSLEEYIVGYEFMAAEGNAVAMRPDEVIHFKRPNPLNAYRGMGPVQAAIYDIDTEKFVAQYARNWFFNSATPGGFIKTGVSYDPETEKRLMQQFENRHGGPDKPGKVGILWGQMDWMNVQVSAREMQLIQIRKQTRDNILGIFQIPLPVMGITEDVNRANAEAGYYIYAKEVITPRLRRLKNALDEHFLPMFEDGLEWIPDNVVPEDRDSIRHEWEAGVITLDEARVASGYAELPGGKGKVRRVGQAEVPVESAARQPVPKEDDDVLEVEEDSGD